MDCPSDTESDLSCPRSPKAQRKLLLTQLGTSGVEQDEFPLRAVQRAIQKFRDRETADILQDASYLLAVQESSELVLQFLNHIPKLLGTHQNSQALLLFAELGTNSHYQLLLNFRKYLRIVAYQEGAASKTAMLVTWTDVLIAKISSLAIPIAAGTVAYGSIEKEPEWLQLRREEDTIRAATQLPDTWAAIITVVGCNTFSPAARRLAASLAFIAYVMVPQITSETKRTDNNPAPLEVLQAAYTAINQASCIIGSPSVSHPFLDKVQIAMLISLFANLYPKIVNPGEMTCVSQLRPEGFGHILDSMQSIMGRSESFFVLEELDPPQCILLRWGNVVPWSWTTWNDQRVANTETIRSLSATWLYLMGAPVYGPQCDTLHQKVFGIDLRCVLLDDLFSSSLMILQLLQEVGRNNCLPHITSNILTKLSWAVVQYMEAYALFPMSHFETRISEFCRSLLLLFPIAEPYQEGAMSFIVEALALTPSDIISVVVQKTCQDRETQFMANLEGAMRSYLTAISDQGTGNKDSRKGSAKFARSLLDFLSILLLRSTFDHPILRGCLSSFLIQVAQLLLSNVPGSSLCVVLLDSFLMALAAFRKRKLSLKIGDEAIWLLAMGMHGSRLRTAAAFAFFLLSTAEGHRECLLKHEAWNYLLDILTKVVEKQCPEEEEPLALLVSPSLCYALHSVVLASDELTRKYLLSSPWTLTMRLSLQGLLLADTVPTDPYFKVLKERLQKAGIDLLNVLVAGHVQVAKVGGISMGSLHSTKARLVYYRDHTESGLVPVYDVMCLTDPSV